MIKLDQKKIQKISKTESKNFDGNFENPKHSFYCANGIIFILCWSKCLCIIDSISGKNFKCERFP
jgi:hypothetical protein